MASKTKPPVALIAGPTASGKSALALAAAERTGGVIVNADGAQVYFGTPVLSAAPSAVDLGRAEHRLYGVLDGAEACSAATWAKLARQEIADIHASGRLPIVVGGTGLYLRTLLEGIAPVPAINPAVRRTVRSTDVSDNFRKLQTLDSDAAGRLNARDTTRISRALEVILSTGRTLREWQAERQGGIGDDVELRPLLLLPPRDWLYARCDRRFRQMFASGGIEEVKALLARKLNPNLPIMRAIGVRESAAYLRGELSAKEAIAAGQQATRRYAKRQYTWFAHQPPQDWARFRDVPGEETLPAALELLGASA